LPWQQGQDQSDMHDGDSEAAAEAREGDEWAGRGSNAPGAPFKTTLKDHIAMETRPVPEEAGKGLAEPCESSSSCSSSPVSPIPALRPTWLLELRSESSQTANNADVPRANIAATPEKPFGTQEGNWAKEHEGNSVLQQHCAFFGPDNDGIVWPWDVFWGFHELGYALPWCILSVMCVSFAPPKLASSRLMSLAAQDHLDLVLVVHERKLDSQPALPD
jgi:hypothetical protein